VATLGYIARWLAWQLREPDLPVTQSAARITVFSSPERR
jgi:hypothetical protein